MEALKDRIDELRRRAERHVKVSFFSAKPEPHAVKRLAWAGVDRCIFYVPADAEPDSVEGLLDDYAMLR